MGNMEVTNTPWTLVPTVYVDIADVQLLAFKSKSPSSQLPVFVVPVNMYLLS